MGSAALAHRRAIWMLVLAASLAGLLLSAAPARAESCTSTASGAWDDPATFSCPGDADDIPDSGDAVTISGHVVSIPSGAPTFASLTVTGNSQLNFNGGGPMTVTGDLHMSNVSVVGSSNEQLVANGATYFQTDGAFVDFRNGGRITFNGPVTHSAGSLFIRSNGGPAPLVRVNSTYTFSGGIISEGIENTTLFYVAEGGSLLTTGTRSVGPAIEIDGFVHVQTGTLTLTSSAAAATHTGDIQVDGTSVQLGGGGGGWHFVADVLPDVTGIRGPGTLVSAAMGPVTLDDGVELGVGGVSIAGTGAFVLAGTGPIPTTTTVTHSAGSREGSRGWNIGTLNLSSGTHVGTGTDTVTNLNKTAGTYDLRDGARLIVNGTATHTAGGLWVRDAGGGDPLLRINGTYNLNGGEIGEGTLANGPLVEITATGMLTSTSAGTHNVAPPTTNAGSITVPAGHTFQFPRGLAQTAGTTTVAGTLEGSTTLAGGVLTGGGTTGALVNTAGTVAPGGSPGTLTVSGNYTQSSAGTLATEIDGVSAGQFDRLVVSGTASLDGTLAIDTAPAFFPPEGTTFEVVSGARTGQFSSITGASDPGGVQYDVAYGASGVTLEALASDPVASVNDVTDPEGDAGTTPFTFTVALSVPAPAGGIAVDYATPGVSASDPSDYSGASGTLNFAQGEIKKTVTVNINGDTDLEPNEVFEVNLSNLQGSGTIGDGQGYGVILNDDEPTLSINDVFEPEGDTGEKPFVFTVSLSSPAPSGGVTVDYATADSTASAGVANDYESASGALSFAQGEVTKTVTVAVNGDHVKELPEQFTVNLSNAVGASIADGQGRAVIQNDDLPLLVVQSQYQRSEGNSGTGEARVWVTLDREAPPGGVTVEYFTTDGSAVAPSDYTATAGQLNFAPGDRSESISVPVNGDMPIESDEDFFVNLRNPSGADILPGSEQGRAVIANDDEAIVSINETLLVRRHTDGAVIADSGVRMSEHDQDTRPMTFTVSLARPAPQGGVSVDYTTVNDSATAPSDYAERSGTLTFAEGQDTLTIDVPVNGDEEIEPSQNFYIDLSNPAGTTASLGHAHGLGVILNDDYARELSIRDLTKREGTRIRSGHTYYLNFDFDVVLSHPAPDQGVSFDVEVVGGTATRPADYILLDGAGQSQPSKFRRTISRPGDTERITVRVEQDQDFERDEVFFVRLSNASRATIVDGEGVGTILNDDTATLPSFTFTGQQDQVQQLDKTTEVGLTCVTGCIAQASGSLIVSRASLSVSARAAAGPKQFPLRGDKVRIAAGKKGTLKLGVPPKARRAATQALQRGDKVFAKVKVKTTSNGKSVTKRKRVRFRRG